MTGTIVDSALPTYSEMLAAHDRIGPHIRRTPLRVSDYLSGLVGADVFFKCEMFQEPGAFKVRGAVNAVFGLEAARAAQGVATHSSGNHASCLSYAAMLRGIPCNVVMPRTAPQAKKDTVRRYGGRITECEPSTSSREETFARVQAETGGDFVHPYNDPRVIAGQGTCAREVVEQTGGVDVVLAPIGGGGMISGTCLTLATLAPETKVIAAEPEAADDAYRSFKAGRLIADDAPKTIADGLLVPLKELTWHFVSTHVNDILTVSEDEIVAAMKLLWKHLRVVAEPSSAVPFAALLKHKDRFQGQRVAIILTGGNVDLDRLPWSAAP